MVLLDTSVWVEGLRAAGKPEVRRRLDELLAADEAAWCDVIRLELWHGARGQKELSDLQHLDTVIQNLPTDDEVWKISFDLARKARTSGLTVPAPDLIIVACARRHGVPLEHADNHLERLLKI